MEKSNLIESPENETVWSVFKYVVSHPLETFFWRWNWKAAILSGVMRGSIYFFTHISLGIRAAMGAMSVEFMFRVVNSGFSASVSQAFRNAQPKWLATICIMVLMPAWGHTIEYTLHTLNGDAHRNRSILISMSFSATSALFNLYAMRRGAMLVHTAEQKSFWHDLFRLPRIAVDFAIYPFVWLFRKLRS